MKKQEVVRHERKQLLDIGMIIPFGIILAPSVFTCTDTNNKGLGCSFCARTRNRAANILQKHYSKSPIDKSVAVKSPFAL